MSRTKERWWDDHPCALCGEAPSLLEDDLCKACNEVTRV